MNVTDAEVAAGARAIRDAPEYNVGRETLFQCRQRIARAVLEAARSTVKETNR